jgi:hypothetical protein
MKLSINDTPFGDAQKKLINIFELDLTFFFFILSNVKNIIIINYKARPPQIKRPLRSSK